jgi:hypothetical protein
MAVTERLSMRATIAGTLLFVTLYFSGQREATDLFLSTRGIAWAPACGKAMAELVDTGECTCLDLAPFSPSRFTAPSSRRGRKKQGVDVGEQW